MTPDVTPVDALRARQCALPTAWRPTPFREFVLKIHSRCDLTEMGDGVDVRLKLQTNGTRLGAEHLQLFAELGVRVGVSLDGDRTAHDRHRCHIDGAGSYDTVIRALRELGRQRYAALFSGLLCTIDLRNDPATGLHVAHDSFDAALRLPVFIARQLGVAALSRTCQQCGVRRICGGGLYAHRYRNGSGFTHPSVYCPDLYRLITYIRQRLASDIEAVRKRSS